MCGSQWPVCSPLWWAPHGLNPGLISHSPVVKATHRPLLLHHFPCHVSETHTHTDSPWSEDFGVCLSMSAILRVLVVCACRVDVMRPRKYAKPTQKHLQYPQRVLSRRSMDQSVSELDSRRREDRGNSKKDCLESSTKMGQSEVWKRAIDPQSESSGFHVSICQVSAIGWT